MCWVRRRRQDLEARQGASSNVLTLGPRKKRRGWICHQRLDGDDVAGAAPLHVWSDIFLKAKVDCEGVVAVHAWIAKRVACSDVHDNILSGYSSRAGEHGKVCARNVKWSRFNGHQKRTALNVLAVDSHRKIVLTGCCGPKRHLKGAVALIDRAHIVWQNRACCTAAQLHGNGCAAHAQCTTARVSRLQHKCCFAGAEIARSDRCAHAGSDGCAHTTRWHGPDLPVCHSYIGCVHGSGRRREAEETCAGDHAGGEICVVHRRGAEDNEVVHVHSHESVASTEKPRNVGDAHFVQGSIVNVDAEIDGAATWDAGVLVEIIGSRVACVNAYVVVVWVVGSGVLIAIELNGNAARNAAVPKLAATTADLLEIAALENCSQTFCQAIGALVGDSISELLNEPIGNGDWICMPRDAHKARISAANEVQPAGRVHGGATEENCVAAGAGREGEDT
jgi:hypothetical protein